MPHITVNDEKRLKVLKQVEKKFLYISFGSFKIYKYAELESTKKVVWSLKTILKLEKPWFLNIDLQKKL